MRLPVIPQGRGASGPLESDLDIDILDIESARASFGKVWLRRYLLVHIVQVVQDDIALTLVKAYNAPRHGFINEQRLPACGWVDSHKGVLSQNMLWPGMLVASLKVGVGRAVHCLAIINDLAELRRKLLVCRVATCPQCVSTDCGHSVVVQMGNACGLQFMHEVGVPARGATWIAEIRFALCSLQSWPDHSRAFDAWHVGCLRMDLNHTVVIAESPLLLWRNILVAEEHNGTFGN